MPHPRQRDKRRVHGRMKKASTVMDLTKACDSIDASTGRNYHKGLERAREANGYDAEGRGAGRSGTNWTENHSEVCKDRDSGPRHAQRKAGREQQVHLVQFVRSLDVVFHQECEENTIINASPKSITDYVECSEFDETNKKMLEPKELIDSENALDGNQRDCQSKLQCNDSNHVHVHQTPIDYSGYDDKENDVPMEPMQFTDIACFTQASEPTVENNCREQTDNFSLKNTERQSNSNCIRRKLFSDTDSAFDTDEHAISKQQEHNSTKEDETMGEFERDNRHGTVNAKVEMQNEHPASKCAAENGRHRQKNAENSPDGYHSSGEYVYQISYNGDGNDDENLTTNNEYAQTNEDQTETDCGMQEGECGEGSDDEIRKDDDQADDAEDRLERQSQEAKDNCFKEGVSRDRNTDGIGWDAKDKLTTEESENETLSNTMEIKADDSLQNETSVDVKEIYVSHAFKFVNPVAKEVSTVLLFIGGDSANDPVSEMNSTRVGETPTINSASDKEHVKTKVDDTTQQHHIESDCRGKSTSNDSVLNSRNSQKDDCNSPRRDHDSVVNSERSIINCESDQTLLSSSNPQSGVIMNGDFNAAPSLISSQRKLTSRDRNRRKSSIIPIPSLGTIQEANYGIGSGVLQHLQNLYQRTLDDEDDQKSNEGNGDNDNNNDADELLCKHEESNNETAGSPATVDQPAERQNGGAQDAGVSTETPTADIDEPTDDVEDIKEAEDGIEDHDFLPPSPSKTQERRFGVCYTTAQLRLCEDSGPPTLHVHGPEDAWTEGRREAMENALGWVTMQLEDMREQDYELARRLKEVNSGIREVKIQRCCEKNREALDNALDDYADPARTLTDSVPEALSSVLKDVGLTKMNLKGRRFSVM